MQNPVCIFGKLDNNLALVLIESFIQLQRETASIPESPPLRPGETVAATVTMTATTMKQLSRTLPSVSDSLLLSLFFGFLPLPGSSGIQLQGIIISVCSVAV